MFALASFGLLLRGDSSSLQSWFFCLFVVMLELFVVLRDPDSSAPTIDVGALCELLLLCAVPLAAVAVVAVVVVDVAVVEFVELIVDEVADVTGALLLVNIAAAGGRGALVALS